MQCLPYLFNTDVLGANTNKIMQYLHNNLPKIFVFKLYSIVANNSLVLIALMCPLGLNGNKYYKKYVNLYIHISTIHLYYNIIKKTYTKFSYNFIKSK